MQNLIRKRERIVNCLRAAALACRRLISVASSYAIAQDAPWPMLLTPRPARTVPSGSCFGNDASRGRALGWHTLRRRVSATRSAVRWTDSLP